MKTIKINVLENTGDFVKGIAEVVPEVAARLIKTGQAEIFTEPKEEEKAPEIPSENTGTVANGENAPATGENDNTNKEIV